MKSLTTKIVLCLFTVFSCVFSIQAQTQFQWVHGGGSPWSNTTGASWNDEGTYSMCTDPNGNIYALSYVGPTPPLVADTFSMTGGAYGAGGANVNILITSYNCSGQMRWAKLIGSSEELNAYGITADSSGHIYLAGNFNHNGGSNTLYIGYDTAITGLLYETAGIIQLDTTGHFNWIRFVGNNTLASLTGVISGLLLGDTYNNVVIDGANNAHFFCYMKSGVPLMTGVTSSFGVYDMTYNPSGTLLSAVRLDIDSEWFLHGAVIDPATNKLYVCGEINQSLVSGGTTDSFYAAAFDASRSRLWMYFCGYGDDDGFTGVVLGQDKSLYFSGAAQPHAGETRFVFNGDSLLAPYDDLSIAMKTDTNGKVNWMRSTGDHLSVNGFYGITLLPNNKVACVGLFAGTLYYGNDTSISYYDIDSLTTPAGFGYSPYLTIYDSAGDMQTIQQIFGDGFYNGGYAITSDNTSNVYVGGKVVDSIYGSGIPAYHTVGGNTDFFVMKYGVSCSCTTPPIASYSAIGTHTVNFIYTGTPTGLDSVTWNFGDGDTAFGLTLVHTYTVPGTYHACAIGYNTCGTDIYCSDITIPCFTPPVSSFTDTGFHTFGFTYTGTVPGVDSMVWNFGDGSTGTGISPFHTYSSAGTYTVCATAWSACGNDTSCNTVSVPCVAAPAAAFTDTGMHTVGFVYIGTTVGIDSIVWKFGDGHTGTGTSPFHTYTATGTFTACVTAYTLCGDDSVCHSVVIPCVSAPVSSFTDTGTHTAGYTYTGTTAGLDSVQWHFGDGSSDTGSNVLHTYTAAGTYTVCATAYNPCGNNTSCSTITVPCVTPPVASFTDTGTHTVGFVYTGTTTGLDSVTWTFGDGATATGTSPFHTYSAIGTYTVCATAYNPCGSNTICSTVTITCFATPVASYIESGLYNIGFTYTGTTANLDSVVWTYGDGTSDTGLIRTHSYTSIGTFTVCVTVYTTCGSDAHCGTVTVPCISAPIATFTDTGTHTVGFVYTGTTTGIDSVAWSFGDGHSDTGIIVYHTYTVADTYHVCVTAYNACGSDSVCHSVITHPLGITSFALANIQVYPNPAMNELIVTGITENTNYRLLSVTGVSLQYGVLRAGTNTIPIQDYAPGIYMLELISQNGLKDMVRVVKE